MRNFILVLCLGALTALAESRALFNGKDLSGWKVAEMAEGGKVAVLADGTVECGLAIR